MNQLPMGPPVRPIPASPARPETPAGVCLIDLPTWSRRLTAVLLHEVPEAELPRFQSALGWIRQCATDLDRIGIVCRVPPPTSMASIELAVMRLVDTGTELFQDNQIGEDPHSIERRRLATAIHRSVRALRKFLLLRPEIKGGTK